ncbi:hypothetical protein [Paracoccus aminovorans]|uniref:hypothetical protein n=1 Tax=Paracoccus aminovorans TaxID=34004 RepID=UPI002B26342E|nr:hypothetical protein [Paracoccus aminovorans]
MKPFLPLRPLALALAFGPAPGWAQGVDLVALMAQIDKSSGQYEQLIGILQGSDSNRALAAFDAMLRSGDKTLTEVALEAGLSATDSRLRARALWEALSHKSALSIVFDEGSLDETRKQALIEWSGQVVTLPLYAAFADRQCLNLSNSRECVPDKSVSVAGLGVDIRFDGYRSYGLNAQFSLDESGTLVGLVTNPSSNATFPARIVFR